MTITFDKLVANFYPVDDLGDGLVRCSDELPRRTIHTYFKLPATDGFTPFVVSDDFVDDAFAATVLKTVGDLGVERLTKTKLPTNAYGFTHVLSAPRAYHAHLKGRLDAERARATLCVPIFESEFSGSETPETFGLLFGRVVPTSDWRRAPHPKIALRFDNTKTKGGTGDGYVLARFDLVLRETDNLLGVADGFIEILNHRDEVVELLFSQADMFTLIENRDDAAGVQISREALQEWLWVFLTR